MLFLRPELLLWDGGSCRHIINGLMMVENHQIPVKNYASAIYPEVESVTRSWLADLISGAFYHLAGLNGVVFICSLAIVLGLTWSYQMGRARGLGLGSGLIMLSIVMATVGMHWSARSHIYSYLPFLAAYYFVFFETKTTWRTAVGLALTILIWANLHGSFMIGLAMIALKAIFDAITLVRNNKDDENSKQLIAADQFKWDLITILLAVLTSCLNPRFISFYSHVAGYLTNPEILHKTDEWRAFDLFAGIGSFAFLLLLAISLTLIFKTKKFASGAELTLFIVLIFAGFESMRLIPYCALLAMPVVGPAWREIAWRYRDDTIDGHNPQEEANQNDAGNQAEIPKQTGNSLASDPQAPAPAKEDDKTGQDSSAIAKLCRFEQRAQTQESSSLKIALGSMVVSLVMGTIMLLAPWAKINEFDPERIPVNAVAYMRDHHIEGSGFNYDNWGGYLYFTLHRRVFIDDWADFLPPQFLEDYLDVLMAKPGWQKKFDDRNFQWVLVPNESQLAQLLSSSPQWRIAYKDKTAVLLLRAGSEH